MGEGDFSAKLARFREQFDNIRKPPEVVLLPAPVIDALARAAARLPDGRKPARYLRQAIGDPTPTFYHSLDKHNLNHLATLCDDKQAQAELRRRQQRRQKVDKEE